ncbi:MAG: DUF6345 domain-containing protein [Planctomycetota bacterium]
MRAFRKNSIICLLILTFFAAPIKLCAYEVSSGSACRTPDAHPDAVGFYNKVKSSWWWSGNWYGKYWNLQERYYTYSNPWWVDDSDIHYHVGHGGDRWDSGYWRTHRAVIFWYSSMKPSEARNLWGNNDLEWIGFRCCKLLNNNTRKYWHRAMNRLHLICGFKTNSHKADSFGSTWGQQMLWRKTVTQAWFSAVDQTQRSYVCARVLAEVYNNYNDRLWGYGYVSSDPYPNSWYWYWDHWAGSPPHLFVNHLTEMTEYEVLPRTVDESYVRGIGDAFGFGLGDSVEDAGDSFTMSRPSDPALEPNDPNYGSHLLEVSKASGQYYYNDTSKLWRPNLNLNFYNEPLERANEFLTNNGLLPPDKGATDIEYENLIREDSNDPAAPNEVYPQTAGVVYARQVETGPSMEMVSVAGTGAKLKVYIHEDGSIIGGMGNWREIQPAGMLTVMPKEQAWSLFEQYGKKVSLEPIIEGYDRVKTDSNTATQGYYEYSGLEVQAKLIPVWIFDVDYYKGPDLVTAGKAYIPAAHSYCPPVATIVTPENGTEFSYGHNIQFTSTTEAGLGTPPYTYEWQSDVDGALSTEPNFATSSMSISCINDESTSEVAPHIISLTITDTQGLKSTEKVNVKIQRLAADLNCDGIVNFKDFTTTGNQWLQASFPSQAGHWSFNEGGGTTAADTGSGGNDCNLIGEPDWVNDPNRGSCLDFFGLCSRFFLCISVDKRKAAYRQLEEYIRIRPFWY